jgi:hypothetical protein
MIGVEKKPLLVDLGKVLFLSGTDVFDDVTICCVFGNSERAINMIGVEKKPLLVDLGKVLRNVQNSLHFDRD